MPESNFKKITKTLLYTLLILVFIYLAFVFIDILIMLSISILLALIFNPFVTWLECMGIHRSWAILLLIITISACIFFGFSFFIPQFSDQLNTLSDSIRHANLKQTLMNLDRSITRYVPFIKSGTIYSRFEAFISTGFVNLLNSMTYFLSSIVSIVAIAVVVPFMTFFILRDSKKLFKGLVNIMPNKYFEMSYSVLRQITIQLGRFVRGWIFDAFMVGFLSTIGLSFLGINNAVPIGIIAGIGHLIPYFGPIVGGIPAIIISVAQFGNFSMLPKIIVMFLAIYAIDNGIIQPNVFSRSVDMHPLVIIILIIAGSQIMGVMGMLLAVPTATVIRTAAKEIYHAYKNYQIIRT